MLQVECRDNMDVITFGESMVLFNPNNNGPLRYVHNFTKSIAGAESNVAIALARLGHDSGWFSRVGDDEFGRYIISTIRGEGVDVSRTITDKTKNTGLLFKERFSHVNPNVYYYRNDSAASCLCPEDLDMEYIKSAKILHITGITPALSPSSRETVLKAVEVARNNGVTVSFDPNIRLKLWSIDEARETIMKIAAMADIIFPGIDEGEMLLETSNPENIAKSFLDMGCQKVVVKLGKDGCYATDGKDSCYVEGYIIESPIDTVGAGDGFAAGFLSGILNDYSLKESSRLANAVGAMATLVRGDMEGFPTLCQVDQFMGKTEVIDR
jgi:2-dehydro-3-deoxygluconokinase